MLKKNYRFPITSLSVPAVLDVEAHRRGDQDDVLVLAGDGHQHVLLFQPVHQLRETQAQGTKGVCMCMLIS